MNTDGDEHAALVKQLQSLRPRAGMTLEKLAKADFLLAVLARRDGKTMVTPGRAREILVSELNALGDGNNARAARNSLNLGARETEKLEDRRSYFAVQVGVDSNDTIENWENIAFRELAHRLLSITNDGDASAEAVEVGSPRPDARWVNELVERTTRYDGKSLRDVLVTRTISALVDGLQTCTIRYRLKMGSPSDAIGVEAYTSCIIEQVRHQPNGTLEATLRFPQPLTKGQSHTFSYRFIATNKATEANPCFIFWAEANNPTRRLIVKTQFNGAAHPGTVWRIDGRSKLEGPGSADECPPVVLDAFGFSSLEFSEMEAGYGYGVAWQWPDDSLS